MPATFEPIATTTLGSAASTITFSSISGSYTDLRVVLVGSCSAFAAYLQFNGVTTTTYSHTYLFGNGSSGQSGRQTSNNFIAIAPNWSGDSTKPGSIQLDIFSYAGSTNKTLLSAYTDDENGSGYVGRVVGLWRSTSAITQVTLTSGGADTFSTGTTATLYGIKAA